jgi:aryl-alcohol dehydrogenase-like predicted oxidoreductase
VIDRIAFGRTGHESTRTIFGAAAFMYDHVTQADADATLELLLRYGVNHIDTAASYGDSELRIAPWLVGHRDDFFVATKTGERTKRGAHDEIRRSLDRLGVERVDLIQLHNLVDRDEWETAHDGALRAVVEARDEGLVRFIGVTGHGLEVARRHIESLERFDFDAVLFPYNYAQLQDERYAADVEELIALCEERGVAIQTIKSLSKGRWPNGDRHSDPWYEPLRHADEIADAVAWTLARPGIFLNTVSDLTLLPHVFEAAANPGTPPSDERMRDLGMRPLFDAANPA